MIDITQQKGLATELHCLQDLTQLGIQCLMPFGDSCRYDVLADLGKVFARIQCKTSTWVTDTVNPQVAFHMVTARQTTNTQRTVRYKYSSDEIDYFYTWFQGQGYLVSIQEAIGSTFRFRYVYPSSGQKQGIHLAEQYKIEEVLKELII